MLNYCFFAENVLSCFSKRWGYICAAIKVEVWLGIATNVNSLFTNIEGKIFEIIS